MMSSDTGKKRILLVNTNTEKFPYPVPPAGLCMLASHLESQYSVKVYDGISGDTDDLPAFVNEFSPHFIGFGIRNIDDVVAERSIFYIDEIIEKFIEPVKKITDAPLILGGSGFSIFPEELLRLTGVNYGVSGEGEKAIEELIEIISSGKPVPLPYLHRGKATGEISGTGRSNAFRFIDFSKYPDNGIYPVQTKRGCSAGCIYCSYPLIEGKKTRLRSSKDIVDEIEEAAGKAGNVTFEFVDSTFNDPPGHAESICREIISRKLKVRMRTMGINPRNCSQELFVLMKEAGFAQVDVTPDTASESMLKSLKKGFTVSDVRKMALYLREADMPAMWFFLFGGPGENEATFSETVRFIDEYVDPNDLVYMNYGIRIYPGTSLYRTALKEGIVTKDQNLLYPPVFYFPPEPVKSRIKQLINETAEHRINCMQSVITRPDESMMKEAIEMRKKSGISEPMFRTLLKVKRLRKSEGRL